MILMIICIVSIIFISNKKTIILLGILYDLLFSYVLFTGLICFYLMYIFIRFIKFKFNKSYSIYIISILSEIIIYYIWMYISVLIINVNIV